MPWSGAWSLHRRHTALFEASVKWSNGRGPNFTSVDITMCNIYLLCSSKLATNLTYEYTYSSHILRRAVPILQTCTHVRPQKDLYCLQVGMVPQEGIDQHSQLVPWQVKCQGKFQAAKNRSLNICDSAKQRLQWDEKRFVAFRTGFENRLVSFKQEDQKAARHRGAPSDGHLSIWMLEESAYILDQTLELSGTSDPTGSVPPIGQVSAPTKDWPPRVKAPTSNQKRKAPWNSWYFGQPRWSTNRNNKKLSETIWNSTCQNLKEGLSLHAMAMEAFRCDHWA